MYSGVANGVKISSFWQIESYKFVCILHVALLVRLRFGKIKVNFAFSLDLH